ncbi:unnamed protein product [Porites evermanni]|uniref:Uncharacterized protein n=1 Tax=Porites evermanni TaxID=104178 RepID=A0ABN8QF31_9CNID|nr:unnamed protein product [Porites evermanni]
MKILLATLISLILCSAVAWSLTCYRCGGTSPACTSSSKDTVACGDESLPKAEYGCRVYTVNYTSLNSVFDIKGCCFVEDCKKDPCEGSVQGAVCSNVASCQSDKCNYNYTTAMAGPRPTVSSKANIVFYGRQVTALIILAILYLSM